MKREPDAWGYNWAILSLGDIWSSRLGVGRKAIIIVKSKEMKNGWSNLRQIWQNLPIEAMAQKALLRQ
jgi:hypothetical protein